MEWVNVANRNFDQCIKISEGGYSAALHNTIHPPYPGHTMQGFYTIL